MQAGESIVPDLQIFVSEASGDPKTLSFRATAADPRLGFGTFVDYGQTTLRVDPVRYLDGLFSQLQVSGTDAFARLEDAGVRLFEELLPFELRRRLWRARSQVGTLFVVTAEAWIPWELLKLQDPEGEEIGPFFAEAFAMGRWLSSSGQRSSAALQLPLRRLGLIFPKDSGLPQAKHEKRELLAHAGENRQIVEIGAQRSEIARAMAEGGFDGWHFCGHGQIAEGEIEPWYLQIEADTFDPNQLHGRARRLGANHPLIFLNACHGGRAGEGLAGLAGLPASFLQIGAGAFIGPLWQVSDDGAALFARVFYGAFLEGASLGAAIREARRQLRQEDPADPTWLAYILLGHPSAMCRECRSEDDRTSATSEPAGRASSPPGEPKAWRGRLAAASSARQARSSFRFPLALAATALMVASVAAASVWPVATLVRLEGRVSRFSALVGPEGASLLDRSVPFELLTAAKIAAAEAVTPAGRPQALELANGNFLSTITAASNGGGKGALSPLDLSPGQEWAMRSERFSGTLALRIEGTPAVSPYEIVLPPAVALSSPQADLAGNATTSPALLRLFPGRYGLLLETEIAGSAAEPPLRLLARPAEVERLAFAERRSSDGTLRSTIRQLRISFPLQPRRGFHELESDGTVELGGSDRFRLGRLELDPSSGDLIVAFEGRASQVRAGVAGDLKDLRSSLLETRKGEIMLLASLLSVAAAVAAGRRIPFFRGLLPGSGRTVAAIVALALHGLHAEAQELSASAYQDRGDRFEGRQTILVGGAEIELVGAMAGPPAPAVLPENLVLSFYLEETVQPEIVVRERHWQRGYWLDRVRPSKTWTPRCQNSFTWPTAAALRPLDLVLDQLVALVRLGYGGPRIAERVAPARLGPAATPTSGGPYRFVFETSRPARLTVRLSGCRGEVEPASLVTPRRIPFEITVHTSDRPFHCLLDIDGKMIDDATRVFQTVEFSTAEEGARQ